MQKQRNAEEMQKLRNAKLRSPKATKGIRNANVYGAKLINAQDMQKPRYAKQWSATAKKCIRNAKANKRKARKCKSYEMQNKCKC